VREESTDFFFRFLSTLIPSTEKVIISKHGFSSGLRDLRHGFSSHTMRDESTNSFSGKVDQGISLHMNTNRWPRLSSLDVLHESLAQFVFHGRSTRIAGRVCFPLPFNTNRWPSLFSLDVQQESFVFHGCSTPLTFNTNRWPSLFSLDIQQISLAQFVFHGCSTRIAGPFCFPLTFNTNRWPGLFAFNTNRCPSVVLFQSTCLCEKSVLET
jgi:hypothetical protein